MDKRRFVRIGSALLAVLLAAAVAACGPSAGGQDDFYKGQLSAYEYDSYRDAAEGFLQNEVQGGTRLYAVDYRKGEALSRDRLAALDIPDDVRAEIVGAYAYDVTYTDNPYAGATAKTVTCYILDCEQYCRYYAPPLHAGDKVTRGYMQALSDDSKYLNFTCTMKYLQTVSAASGSESATQRNDYRMTVQCQDRYMYTKTVMDGDVYETFCIFENDIRDMDTGAYIEYSNDNDRGWLKHTPSHAGSGDDDDDSPLSHDCFVKTGVGFALDDASTDTALAALKDLLDEPTLEFYDDPELSLNVNVDGGRIRRGTMKIRARARLTLENARVSVLYTANGDLKIEKFGKTVVSIPKDLPLSALS